MNENEDIGAARLADSAGPGELLVSEAALRAANIPIEGLAQCSLELKGLSDPIAAYVLQAD